MLNRPFYSDSIYRHQQSPIISFADLYSRAAVRIMSLWKKDFALQSFRIIKKDQKVWWTVRDRRQVHLM